MPDRPGAAVPHVRIAATVFDGDPNRGLARIGWEIENVSGELLEIVESWLPHGRFFAEREPFRPELILPTGARTSVDRYVRYSAAPAELIENAFLILSVRFRSRRWRILCRMRVTCARTGALGLAVEAITAHPVGFASAEGETGRRGEADRTGRS